MGSKADFPEVVPTMSSRGRGSEVTPEMISGLVSTISATGGSSGLSMTAAPGVLLLIEEKLLIDGPSVPSNKRAQASSICC